MSLHDEVLNVIRREIERFQDVVDISPTAIATATQESLCDDETLEIHIRYTSLEHIKQMARSILSGRYGPESDETEAHQGDMFSGKLQSRYPVPRQRGDDPIYRARENLTYEEARWNADNLRKSAMARTKHADALEAWNEDRKAMA